MSIKQHPGDGTQQPVKVIVDHDADTDEANRAGIEVVSLAIDEFDTGNDPYNQTGRFVSLALKDKSFD
jgi:hypothetical protein